MHSCDFTGLDSIREDTSPGRLPSNKCYNQSILNNVLCFIAPDVRSPYSAINYILPISGLILLGLIGIVTVIIKKKQTTLPM